MPPLTRRALLAAAATGVAGSLSGCSVQFSDSPRGSAPPVVGVTGRTAFVADGVTLPDVDGLDTVDDPTDADVAVFPAADRSVDRVASVLDSDIAATVVGRNAQHTLMQACDADGRSYGFARDSWGSDTRVVAAVPRHDALVTHLFVGADLPRDLPWALGEVFEPAGGDCTATYRSPVVPPGVDERAVTLGASRVRGRNDVAGFDRWDRVRAAPGDDAGVVVDVHATIFAGSAVGGDPRYDADQVRLVASFDERLDGVGPSAQTTDGLRVENTTDPTENTARHVFTPTSNETRRTFTACQRSFVTADEMPEPFSYTANARFRWRDARLLDDDRWHHHTPGRAMWYR